MLRSRRFVLTPFCMLCQGVRAEGIVRHFPSIIKPVVDLLAELKINIIQMPCPELLFDSFHRKPCGKPKYDNPHNRAICRKLAEQVVAQIEMFKVNGCTVEAVLGVEFSPSCAVTIVAGPPPKRREVAEGIWRSRRYRNDDQRVTAVEKNIGKKIKRGWLRTHFGSPHEVGDKA